jgi:alanine racemase
MTSPAPAAEHHGRSEVVVDVAAIRRNVATLRRAVGDAQMMTVVKADGYGHGLVESARAAREGGADWLGVAVMEEALALRAAGDTGPILTWLTVPGERYEACLEAGVDVTAYTVAELDAIAMAARDIGVPARVQLKVDTGLSRGGSTLDLWPGLVEAAAAAEESGAVRVTGVWSHFACSDEPKHPANDEQEQAFLAALQTVEAVGIEPEVVHLANSAAALLRPSSRFDLVRCGIASYGLTPAPDEATSTDLGLVPAMTVRGRLALVKRVPAGSGVSYGHTYVTERDTTVGVVPLGYGDGVPRHASSRAEVLVAGRRRPVLGRVCMDQLVVDLGDDDVATGDEVVLFGDGRDGGPTAQDWADACGTISYEIVTRMGARQPGRMPRVHIDSDRTDNDREDTA